MIYDIIYLCDKSSYLIPVDNTGVHNNIRWRCFMKAGIDNLISSFLRLR